MELVLGHMGNSYGGELYLMEFALGLIVGIILGVAFCLWTGAQVERNLRIPKSNAAKVLTIMTEEAVLQEKQK